MEGRRERKVKRKFQVQESKQNEERREVKQEKKGKAKEKMVGKRSTYRTRMCHWISYRPVANMAEEISVNFFAPPDFDFPKGASSKWVSDG
jgi:hypothetical protein